jgi:limonene-1,2-epoxide hydrolase
MANGPFHAQLQALQSFYENLQPESLPGLSGLYDSKATFKDPFNQVQGVPAIEAVFRHMFATVRDPRFQVQTAFASGNQGFLAWTFTFERSGPSAARMVINGATHVVFNQAGLVAMHRDYWDAAEELYEKLPVLGALMRWLRSRLQAR